jgi:serine/threonine-protein kinase
MNAEEIFHGALARPQTQRRAFLAAICSGDEALERRVEALLHAHENPGSFLAGQPPLPTTTGDEPISERPGIIIGPYKLLEQIGEGGFGVVFMADQQKPVHRKVALKILKPGMDTRPIVGRFEAERQALALMDHANIAKVFDGGATPSGRPFFVMELVKGVPITDFCDQNQLTPRQRLELFGSVCQAVQHAHQKGIIHRDLKPSNVLVSRHDTTPIVKVIDFGVAKALGQKLTDKTLFTGIAQMIGTPLYMSPEQAGMSDLDIDTRSDIYSLGVLLYELLTGTTPFDKERLHKLGYDDLRRIIREEEPPKPSTRISTLGQAATTVCANRKSEPKRLSRLFRGELDWIVMKALEKDRNRRYETANGFAMDVQRYLHDEPVKACPPSRLYRFHKLARRNTAGLAVASLILFSLILLGSGTGWVLSDRASRSAALRAKVNEAVVEARDLLARDQLYEAKANAARAKGLLESSGSNTDHPELARLRKDLEMAEQLQEIRLEQAAVTGFDLEGADPKYGEAFRDYGIDIDALAEEEVVRQVAASAIRNKLALALSNWAFARKAAGQHGGRGWKELLAISRWADPDPLRDRVRRALENEDPEALSKLAGSEQVQTLPKVTLHLLGRELYISGQGRQAVELLQKARLQHPGDFWMNFGLAYCLAHVQPQQLDEVIRFYSVAVTIRTESPGAHLNLGTALINKGNRLNEAIMEFQRAIQLKPDFAAAHKALGAAVTMQGKRYQASEAYHKASKLKLDDPAVVRLGAPAD